MTHPVRLQLSRSKGFNLQALSQATNGLPAVNVARPSKWGNPYKVEPAFEGDGVKFPEVTAETAVALFRTRWERAINQWQSSRETLEQLRGKKPRMLVSAGFALPCRRAARPSESIFTILLQRNVHSKGLTMPRAKKAADTTTAAPITAYKGFNDDWTCRPEGKVFQYEVGKTYAHEGDVEACKSGFHACEHPLDVLSYYSPNTSRFAVVTLGGATAKKGDDSKIAAAEITIKAELRLPELIAAAVKYVFDKAKWIEGTFASGDGEGVKCAKDRGAATASGDGGAATASGNRGAATASGRWGAATASGNRGAATASGTWGAATASGWRGAATASGYQGAATASGNEGAATASGDWGAATASGVGGAATASGDWGAATASGDGGAATASGNRGAATASGTWGAATASGDWGAATASGDQGAATASGYQGKVRGKAGCALFLVERNDSGEIINVWAGIVGKDGIKADTFYRLKAGEPVEIE